MKGITKPGIENFAKLISSETYAVPRFQRDYSWKEVNWIDLWQDVKSIINGEDDERYMGYLVFLQKGKVNEIIDGQQRLITISLMILAFIENLKSFAAVDNDVPRKVQVLRNKYIAEEGVKKGEFNNRIVLNENNNDLYVSFVSGIEMSRKKLTASENFMKKCLQWFTDEIPKLEIKNSEELASTTVNIIDSLYFTTLHVSDDLNAYVVFETLNARGVKLSSTDLLKNYLFQKVSIKGERALDTIESKWKKIVTIIGSEDLVDFIRYYWNSRNKFVRKVDLYRAITLQNATTTSVIQLVDDLSNSAIIYAALNNPQDDYWEGNAKIVEKLQTLKAFKVKQPFIPLLIGKEVLTDKQFEKLLNYCVALSFRYNVICEFPTNIQEDFYSDLAQTIKKNNNIHEIDFKDIYPSNDVFLLYFNNKEFLYNTGNAKIVRYILSSIEKVLTLNRKALPLFDSNMTIEHILPLNPSSDWKIDSDEHKKLVNRLGNLTLLSKQEQKRAGNEKFEIKDKVYKKSEYEISKNIIGTSKNGWDKQMIEQRQEWLGNKAKAIWLIPNI